MNHPIIQKLEQAEALLAQVPKDFVFTGGATIVLYAQQDVRGEIRPTEDVDCAVEVHTRSQYYQLANYLRELGLTESIPICRWTYEELIIDIMPCDDKILGFSNRWYKDGIRKSCSYKLPNGRTIEIFSPLYLLATKIEAHTSRAKSFYHKDIEDIIVLLDGSKNLQQDYNLAEPKLKQYIHSWFKNNTDKLIESVYSFSPSPDPERQDLAIELIENIAKDSNYS